MCFGIRISSPSHLATLILLIQNQLCPKNARNACADTPISPKAAEVLTLSSLLQRLCIGNPNQICVCRYSNTFSELKLSREFSNSFFKAGILVCDWLWHFTHHPREGLLHLRDYDHVFLDFWTAAAVVIWVYILGHLKCRGVNWLRLSEFVKLHH